MTKDNSKKLYDHYIKIGYDKAAKDLLKKYPDFAQTKEETKAEKPKVEKAKE